jgi:hypothetical protein
MTGGMHGVHCLPMIASTAKNPMTSRAMTARTPTAIPVRLLEQWKRIGEYRLERGTRKKA